jgi:acetoin utilization deacetylase AcuC-like enzyme
VADGHLEDPGSPYAIAYWFPAVAGRRGGDPQRPAATIRAELGRFAMDTMTPIGDGTWEGAKAASDAAATAADLVLAGSRSSYAICRPPGHHAGPAFFGGSCYLNNAAVAATTLRRGGVGRVAIVDIDAHHGNGTQACFWDDPAVFYGSVHVDPGAGWFPHTVGYADEVDACGTTRNVPVPPGTGDDGWLTALDRVLEEVGRFEPEAVVVSLGVDAAAEDPNSPLEVTDVGFSGAGRRLAGLDRPTVLVHEGGYVLETLAGHTLAVLEAFST